MMNNQDDLFYPRLVLLMCAGFLFYKYLLQVSPGLMTIELMSTFHINAAGLGNLAACFFYAYLITQLFVGPLLDKFNPRYLTALAILLSAIGALAFSLAHDLLTAAFARGLIGMGAAFATVSYLTMAAKGAGLSALPTTKPSMKAPVPKPNKNKQTAVAISDKCGRYSVALKPKNASNTPKAITSNRLLK